MTTTTAINQSPRALPPGAPRSRGGLGRLVALVGAGLLALAPISSADAQSRRGQLSSGNTTTRQVTPAPSRSTTRASSAAAHRGASSRSVSHRAVSPHEVRFSGPSTASRSIVTPAVYQSPRSMTLSPMVAAESKRLTPRTLGVPGIQRYDLEEGRAEGAPTLSSPRIAPRVAWERSVVVAQAGAAPKQIHVDLVVIHASNAKKGYDPQVERFKKQLGFLSYTGFSLLDQEGFELNMGETHKTTLFEGRMVETTLVSGTDQKVRLKIKLTEAAGSDPLVDTNVQVPRKGTFFVGGPKYKDGVLILPVTATY